MPISVSCNVALGEPSRTVGVHPVVNTNSFGEVAPVHNALKTLACRTLEPWGGDHRGLGGDPLRGCVAAVCHSRSALLHLVNSDPGWLTAHREVNRSDPIPLRLNARHSSLQKRVPTTWPRRRSGQVVVQAAIRVRAGRCNSRCHYGAGARRYCNEGLAPTLRAAYLRCGALGR